MNFQITETKKYLLIQEKVLFPQYDHELRLMYRVNMYLEVSSKQMQHHLGLHRQEILDDLDELYFL